MLRVLIANVWITTEKDYISACFRVAVDFLQTPFLRHVEESRHFDHALFLPLKLPPHSFNFFFGTLHRDGVFCLIVIGLQLERDFINTIAFTPIVDSSIRRNESKEVPVGFSDAREFFGLSHMYS